MTVAKLEETPEPEELTLPLDALVRSASVKGSVPHALLLGAGASVSSGVPSAQSCIWEWKRSIFVTSNPGLEDQFAELSLPSVRQRVQEWLDRQGRYPPVGSPEEYSFYIENCYPICADSQAFFQEKIRSARPHIGYQMVCHLAQAGLVRTIWSTNFDGLPARAAGGFDLIPVAIGP